MSRRYDVCAAVVSDLQFDARVWKEARSLAAAGWKIRLVGCTSSEERSESADGIDFVEYPFGGRGVEPSLAVRLRGVARLWLDILGTRARIYHAHNVHTFPPAYLAARLRGASLAYDAHELYGEAPSGSRMRRLAAAVALRVERFAARSADVVITTNPSRARVLEERHGVSDIVVLANVPAAREELDPLDPGYDAHRVTLLYQGGIYPQSRAFEETIAALRELPDVELVIIGFGRKSTIEQIGTWAHEQGVADRVRLLGPLPFDELVRTAAAADVGLVPIKPDSLGAYLGDTNKLFEYLMAGLPVVASDLPEIRSVVLRGSPTVGEVFDPSDPASIAEAVRRTADPATRAARGRQARELALAEFHWEREGEKLTRRYEEVLGAPLSART